MQNDSLLREYLKTFIPITLLVLVTLLIALDLADPAPPNTLIMASGPEQGAYHLFAQQYQEYLAEQKIHLEIISTEGSLDNLDLLTTEQVDIAFVQGGVHSSQSDTAALHSLGSLFFEPIWVFYHQTNRVQRLTDLRGKSLAIGDAGSGTRAVAIQLLADNGITDENSELLELGGQIAADALLQGLVDAVFFIAPPQSPVVQDLLTTQDIALLHFERAAAYTRRHRFLSRLELPEGVINLQTNVPPQNTDLLAATANLVVRDDVHPALIELLLQIAEDVHGSGGWFEKRDTFPQPDHLAFPLAKEAKQHYKYGTPFLQRYLPFWAAVFLDRIKFMLLPLAALLLPLVKLFPPVYRWRMRSRIYRWYRWLQAIDQKLAEPGAEQHLAHYASELDRIENELTKVAVPLSFMDELYNLRFHLSIVRDKLDHSTQSTEAN